MRRATAFVVVVLNFTPVPRGYRIGLPAQRTLTGEVLDSDSAYDSGSNAGNAGGVEAQALPWMGLGFSAAITLPPLAACWCSSRSIGNGPEQATVLFVTSEVAPLVKTGGLADVSGSLPTALMYQGVDVRVLMPGYPAVMEGVKSKGRLASLPALGELPGSQLLAGKLPGGVPLLIVDCPRLYERPGGPYQDTTGKDWPDNELRFGLLSYLGAILASAHSPISWRPQVLHAHDWQAGLGPAYLHFMPGEKARSVTTYPQPRLPGAVRPGHLRSARAAAALVVDGGAGIS